MSRTTHAYKGAWFASAPFLVALNCATVVLIVTVIWTFSAPLVIVLALSLYAAVISYSLAIRTGEFASIRSALLALVWMGVPFLWYDWYTLCLGASAGFFLTLAILETPEQRGALLANWTVLLVNGWILYSIVGISALPTTIIASALGAVAFIRLLPHQPPPTPVEDLPEDLTRYTIGDDGELVYDDGVSKTRKKQK